MGEDRPAFGCFGGLLSVLFLFSGKADPPTDPLPYAQADIDELAREPRLARQSFLV